MSMGRGFGGKIVLSLEEAMAFGANSGDKTLADLIQKEVEIQSNIELSPHHWIEIEVWGCSGRFQGDPGY